VARASSQGCAAASRRRCVDCKPGSVPTGRCPPAGEDHSSRRRVATALERSHPGTASDPKVVRSGGPPSTVPLFELAPGRACLAAGRPAVARGLLPHDFTLTGRSGRKPDRHTSEVRWSREATRSRSVRFGGVISVALSLGLPRVGVTDFPALWSPDFPPAGDVCPPAIFHPPPAGPTRRGPANRRPGARAPRSPPDRPGRCESGTLADRRAWPVRRDGRPPRQPFPDARSR